MFKEKYKQRNIQKRIVVALALLCLVLGAVDVQFYLEHRVVANIVNYTSRLHRQKKLFDMPIKDLMEVTINS